MSRLKIHQAAIDNDLPNLKIGLTLYNINRANWLGWTALHYASARGYEEIVLFLISERSINVNAQTNLGKTPLHMACSNGHLNIVKILVNCPKININSGSDSINENFTHKRETPINQAIRNGHEEIGQLMLRLPNIDITTEEFLGFNYLQHHIFRNDLLVMFSSSQEIS
eukprot:gb/GECH01004761.1/.p1 GENE.gb/GECH01004761.1/~~gb/GECH01004761.1/.p1  ORF type:complete len:169 (+),score=19.07 gb/GECH01004761.1/:1-507(+)